MIVRESLILKEIVVIVLPDFFSAVIPYYDVTLLDAGVQRVLHVPVGPYHAVRGDDPALGVLALGLVEVARGQAEL